MRGRGIVAFAWVMAGCSAAGGESSFGSEDARAPDARAIEVAIPDEDAGAPVADDGVVDSGSTSKPDTAVALDVGAPIDAGPPGVEDCKSYPFKASTLLAERLGFGRETTGGDPSKIYRVKSLADAGTGTLRAALESTEPWWIVFDVEGTITLEKPITLKGGGNKTIDGRGRAIVIDGNLKIESGTKNVIVSDVTIQYPRGFKTSEGDSIGIRGHAGPGADPSGYDTQNLWFHHLELGRGGDGQLDVRGGTNITISWSHMHSHAKAFLHQRDTDDKVTPGMRITYHHNWFEKITRRSPLFYCGLADYFNNWNDQWYEFGAASNSGAQFLSENNVYEARPGTYCIPGCPDPNSPTGDSDYTVSKDAVVSGYAGEPGYIKSVGDVTLNGAKIAVTGADKVFARATYYAATPEPAGDALKAKLKAQSGPRKTYCK